MAFSWQESVKPAGTQDIQCDIEYLDKSYIHVYLDGAETTAFTWTSSTNIRLNSPLSAETAVLLIRKTEREYLYIEFASGAPFIEGNVDTQNTQFLHLAQELVEGRSIEGFYGDINMHRYRITNLGDPVDVRDAANKQYVDAGDARLDARVDAEAAAREAADDALDIRTTNLEQTYFNANTNSFPWWTVTTVPTTTITPGMPFTKAKVRLNGVTQTAGYSYTVNNGVITFAETLPAGTLVDVTIGIDTDADTSAVASVLGLLSSTAGATFIGASPAGTVQAALNYVTPEMYGAVGDGVADDYLAIQTMFNAAEDGCTFVFDGRKTYYNAFSAGSWTITKPCTVHFNGAKLTRRTPSGTADNQTAVLLISGARDVNLLDVNIDGNNPIGYPYDLSGNQATSGNQTALCQSIDYGVYLLSSTAVRITGKIQKCAFDIWAKNSSDFKIKGVLNYGGQVVPNITSSDLAYGAGIKVSDCVDFDIEVSGKGNANATIELEPNANNGRVVQRSINNLSSGLTITNCYGITFDSYTDNASIGTQITQNGAYSVGRIIGKSIANSCGWGLLLNLHAGATKDMKNISVEAICTNCRSYGLYIFNQNSTKFISYDIRYTGDGNYTNGAGTSGNDIVVTGDCRGRISGSSSGCYNTFLVSGTQSAAFPPKFDLDVKGTLSVDYFVSPGSYADISGTKTKDTHIVSAGANFTKLHMYKLGAGAAQSTLTDWMVKTEHAYYLPMPTSYTFNNSLYAVLDSGSTNTYTVKVRL